MLTKLPDYIISDCGYPNWDRDHDNINLAKIHANLWSTSSIWSTKSANLAKLLPLRETLTDYYMDKLMMRQHESKCKTTTTTNTSSSSVAQQSTKKLNSSNNNSGRQAPRHVNELMMIKNGKRKQHQQISHCSLDKRRSHYTNSLDNDLDQF